MKRSLIRLELHGQSQTQTHSETLDAAAFSLDNSERRPASSNLGRGLFILLGSSQGYGSLMVFMSLKVFHIWARSMLYVSPEEA